VQWSPVAWRTFRATLTFDSMAAIGAAFALKEGQATVGDPQAGAQLPVLETREI